MPLMPKPRRGHSVSKKKTRRTPPFTRKVLVEAVKGSRSVWPSGGEKAIDMSKASLLGLARTRGKLPRSARMYLAKLSGPTLEAFEKQWKLHLLLKGHNHASHRLRLSHESPELHPTSSASTAQCPRLGRSRCYVGFFGFTSEKSRRYHHPATPAPTRPFSDSFTERSFQLHLSSAINNKLLNMAGDFVCKSSPSSTPAMA